MLFSICQGQLLSGNLLYAFRSIDAWHEITKQTKYILSMYTNINMGQVCRLTKSQRGKSMCNVVDITCWGNSSGTSCAARGSCRLPRRRKGISRHVICHVCKGSNTPNRMRRPSWKQIILRPGLFPHLLVNKCTQSWSSDVPMSTL